MFPAWVKLAWREFRRPFGHWRGGCPGGRDFLWLTLLLATVLTLALLLLSSREGLKDRFVDAVLARVPGHGVPIWISNDILNAVAIDNKILDGVRSKGLSVHPYRELGAGQLIQLPGEHVWKETSKQGNSFFGWAVYPGDPLWQHQCAECAGRIDGNLPLEVVLSRPLFEAHFQYSTYRSSLIGRLPKSWSDTLPESIPSVSTLDHIWLRIQVGDHDELFAFATRWVDRIPTMQRVAFLFPLTTFHALQAARYFADLRYFPEWLGNGGSRVKELAVRGNYDKAHLMNFASCAEVGAKFGSDGTGLRFTRPIQVKWVESCASDDGIPYNGTSDEGIRFIEVLDGDRLLHTADGHLLVPCNRLPETVDGACAGWDNQPVRWDVTAWGHGFPHALVYVKDRTLLSQAVEVLTSYAPDGKQALFMHPVYKDAISRFDFLVNMLRLLEVPYLGCFVLLLGSLALVEIGILVGHRRQVYGILVTKGMRWWEVYAMLYLQALLAVTIGLAVATACVYAFGSFLRLQIIPAAKPFCESISIEGLDLLPIRFPADPLLAGMAVLAAAWFAVTIVLAMTPLWRRTAPSVLLHE